MPAKSTTDTSRVNALATSRKSNGKKTRPTSSRGGSHASPTLSRGNGKVRGIQGICGESVSAPFAWYDPDTPYLRTSQASLFQTGGDSSIECCTVWPRSGMMRNGQLYRLHRSALPTGGKGSGLWPTPVANDDNKSPEAHMAMKARMKGGPRKKPTSLNVMVKGVERQMWPTPNANDAKNNGPRLHPTQIQLCQIAGGALNPTWVEWLMGYPLGWTDSKD